ncbi:MAG: carbohydrate ABC transporter permease [Candidatus Zixiibacteriota bacterium]
MTTRGQARGTRKKLLSAALTLLLIGMLLPFAWMVVGAVSPRWNAAWFNPLTESPAWGNFADLFTAMPFGRYFLNSAIVAAVVTIGNVLLCFPVGYALARRRFAGRRVLFGAAAMVLMVPQYVLIVPMFVLMHQLGLYDSVWAIILPVIVSPLGILLVKSAVSTVPIAVEEAARMDGAGSWTIVYRIVMPICRPTLAVLAVQVFWLTWNAFLFPFILTGEKARTLPVALAMFRGFQSVDLPHLFAAATLATLPVIIVFIVFQRQIIAGLTSGAVKG